MQYILHLFVLLQLIFHICNDIKSKSVLISHWMSNLFCHGCPFLCVLWRKTWLFYREASPIYVSLSSQLHADLFSFVFFIWPCWHACHINVPQWSCSLTEQRMCGSTMRSFDHLCGILSAYASYSFLQDKVALLTVCRASLGCFSLLLAPLKFF